MTDLSEFLSLAGWLKAGRYPLAGDASARAYSRLTLGPSTAILMETQPGAELVAFVNIARFLNDAGLSAPRIIAQDQEHGFLLLEDLGDDLFAKVMGTNPELEEPLYQAAIRTLHSLHQVPPPNGLTACTPDHMASLTDLFFDWYAPSDKSQQITKGLKEALRTHAADCTTLVLRDFHAENLIWLPDRPGVQAVGLLDFQDAMVGHPAYDIVSLLQDARRDLSPGLEDRLIHWTITEFGWNRDAFTAAYHVLGAQRNLRILGIFERLAQRDDKPRYRDLIPRGRGHLLRDLAHPALSDVAPDLKDLLGT